MCKKIKIADSELPIMKVLWKNDGLTSPEIFSHIEGNVSTLKTLLRRLVDKGAVKIEEINSRTYRYSAVFSEEEYISYERKSFIKTVFGGSKEKMILNFIKEENITKEDLQKLMDLIEKD